MKQSNFLRISHDNPASGFGRFGRLALTAAALTLASSLPVTWAAGAELEGDHVATQDGDLIIHPVNHASLVLGWKDVTIYVDPVGGEQRFARLPRPNLVLLTDIHGDHLHAATLKAVTTGTAQIIAPQAVLDLLPPDLKTRTKVLKNGDTASLLGLTIEAIPMYNLTPERLQFHSKGRGNGYVISLGGKRVYLSGDTEDIPEMRGLKDIDVAFVCMNLPYTMTVEQAAQAVRAFRPKIVYPYHYRGSDLAKFKKLVGEDLSIDVRLRDWYK
jgi:L-ascorbate metabolism protein UlaG (beta-lactamase superfamily)